MKLRIVNGDFRAQVELRQKGENWWLLVDDHEMEVDIVELSPGVYSLRLGGNSLLLSQEGPDSYAVDGKIFQLQVEDDLQMILKELGWDRARNKRTGKVVAQIPGLVLQLKHGVGDQIKQGEPLLIMEAMKMENEIKAPCDGTITAVHVAEGQTVEKGAPLMDIE